MYDGSGLFYQFRVITYTRLMIRITRLIRKSLFQLEEWTPGW